MFNFFIFLFLFFNLECFAKDQQGDFINLLNKDKTSFSFAPLVEKLNNSVVNIFTTQRIKNKSTSGNDWFFKEFGDFLERFRPFLEVPEAERDVTSLGSGLVIDDSGIIVTNNHVIGNATEITVKFNDDYFAKAKVIGRDKKTDIALLKIKTDKKLSCLNFGDSDEVRVGDVVVAIGNPFGFGGSVSSGIISARGRDINLGPFDDFLQTDAALNRGGSGGGLFNMKGEIVGINTAIFSPSGTSSGLGFAIPSNNVKFVVEKLMSDGKVNRGYMGVRIQPLDEGIAKHYGLEKPVGALVSFVADDGPAKHAGLEVGDLILKFDNKDIANVKDLVKIVAHSPIGQTFVMYVHKKNGKLVNVEITIKLADDNMDSDDEQYDSEDLEEKEHQNSSIIPGLFLKDIKNLNREMKNLYSVKDAGGVIITKVQSVELERKGLRPGQIIVSVNHVAVESIKDLRKQVKVAKKNKSMLLLVKLKEDVQVFVEVALDK